MIHCFNYSTPVLGGYDSLAAGPALGLGDLDDVLGVVFDTTGSTKLEPCPLSTHGSSTRWVES